jgi:hypothetical protein
VVSSHTIWESRGEAWAKSEAFRDIVGQGTTKPLYLDHQQFEGFEVRQTVGRGRAAWNLLAEWCAITLTMSVIRVQSGSHLLRASISHFDPKPSLVAL